MLYYSPGELEGVPLGFCGLDLGRYSRVFFDQELSVGTLDQIAPGDRLDYWFVEASAAYFQQTQILFGGEDRSGLVGVAGGGYRFDEGLGDLCCCVGIYLTVEGEDAAEGTDGVCGEGFFVGFGQGFCRGAAAGVGVLDDRAGGEIEFADKLPGGVEIDQIVVTELFALELGGVGDTS